MPGQKFGERKTYLTIVEGAIRQTVATKKEERIVDGVKVEVDVPVIEGAQRRDYEVQGKKGFKYELVFKSWEGRITDIRLKNGTYGEVFEVEFDDAILSFAPKSRSFTDFAKKLMNADMNKTMTIAPFDFESDGKKMVGVTIWQGPNKLTNYYWDDTLNNGVGAMGKGFPMPEGDYKKFTQDDWTIYWVTVKKFLLHELEAKKLEIKQGFLDMPAMSEEEAAAEMNEAAAHEEMPIHIVEEALPTETTEHTPLNQTEEFKAKQDEDEVRLEDVPF